MICLGSPTGGTHKLQLSHAKNDGLKDFGFCRLLAPSLPCASQLDYVIMSGPKAAGVVLQELLRFENLPLASQGQGKSLAIAPTRSPSTALLPFLGGGFPY